MNIKEWKVLTARERTIWLKENAPASGRGRPRLKVRGLGINDVTYSIVATIDGKQVKCPVYTAWVGMLDRVKREKNHELGRFKICDEWLSLNTFREWWLADYVDGWGLDQDLITSSREYSPDSCVFVPLRASWRKDLSKSRMGRANPFI